MIDLSTGNVRTVPLRISPHTVQVASDGRLLLALGMLANTKMSDESSTIRKRDSEAMARGRMLIFDTATMSVEDSVRQQ